MKLQRKLGKRVYVVNELRLTAPITSQPSYVPSNSCNGRQIDTTLIHRDTVPHINSLFPTAAVCEPHYLTG